MTASNREFVLEASGQIERLSDGFVELERDGFDRGTLDDLFRVAHTLKGNCAAEGFEAPAETAHALEDLLDELRGSPGAFTDAHVDTALEALDVLERQLMEVQSDGTVATDATDVVASIRELVPEPDIDTDADGVGGDDGEDAVDAADAAAVDEIELPSVDVDEDVTVEEALDNAAVFDDLDALEASVETDDFDDDVEGVGLFDAEDGAGDGPGLTGEAAAEAAEVDGAPETEDVTSSTRRDSEPVPGEDSYADLLSDTTPADPEALQAELEDVTFGEFDDDDDLSIGELVDLADETPGDEQSSPEIDRARLESASGADFEPAVDAQADPDSDPEAAPETPRDEDRFSLEDSDTEPTATPNPVAEASSAANGEEPALLDESAPMDVSGENPETGDSFGDPAVSESDEDSTADDSTEGPTRGESDEVLDGDDGEVLADSNEGVVDDAEVPFEFGATETASETAADPVAASGSDRSAGASETTTREGTEADESGFEMPDGEPEDWSVETTDGTTGPDEGVVADVSETLDVAAPTEATDAAAADEAETPKDVTDERDANRTSSGEAVGDIVDRIERLEEASSTDGLLEDVGTDHADEDDATAGGDPSGATPTAEEAGVGADGDDLGFADDELTAAFDAATTVDEPDVKPTDVPDVEDVLAETEFDDVEDVEFATAEFYDRVGFETDSSTGAFVSEFDEAFTDDSLGVDVDRSAVDVTAASTIDPELLDGEADSETADDSPASLETVREVTLDVEEADELLELTEELVVDTQRLAGALPELPAAAADALASLRDVSARIEDHVSDVRLVPLDTAFSGLSRTSRRVARAQDKEVTFLTENADVEVDRQVVDELADPLVHLVRNAIDHGIEPPEERVSKGKNPEGTVLVRADRDGDTITVAVEDDGRGVDPDDLREAAVDAGRYSRAEAAALDREDALELMFDAGLSTVDAVTEVSGRGVGMDVVADVVTRLEGTLDVRSERDVGTTVELTLPVSVALSEVLTMSVGARRFGLPATAVRRVEEFAPERVDDDGYRLSNGEGEHDHVPIVDLADHLDVDRDAASTPARTDVLVLTEAPAPRALRCQDVVDWESVVVQPFDGVLSDHESARGAALVGDGTPVVVLEPPALGGDR